MKQGYLETKTYEVDAWTKDGEYKTLFLQVIEDDIILDLKVQQLFHGTISQYMEYCGYQMESMEEKEIPCSCRLDLIEV